MGYNKPIKKSHLSLRKHVEIFLLVVLGERLEGAFIRQVNVELTGG